MNGLFGFKQQYILLKVLPWTVLFCLLKWVIHERGWEFWAFDSLTGALFGSATFVLALVLGGTLGDYRLSEDMPTQLVNAIETIEDSNQMTAAGHTDYDPLPLQKGLVQVVQAILTWLQQGGDSAQIQEELNALNVLFVPLGQKGGTVNRCQGEQGRIRLLVSQIQGNRDTDFLGSAYILLFVFLIGSVIALLLIGADSFSENLTVSGFLFTSFVYLVILIRDLDNPFQYNGRSSIDVDLTALVNVMTELKKKVEKV